MPSTPILNITEVAPTQNNKETTINTAIVILEQAANASLEVSMSGGGVTLTQDQFTRNVLFICSGGSTETLTVRDTPRQFTIQNDNSGDLTVKPLGAIPTISIPPGKIVTCSTDGLGDIRATSSGVGLLQDLGDIDFATPPGDGDVLMFSLSENKWIPGAFASSNFTGLADTPANYTGAANRHVRVNSGATGLIFDTLTIADVGGLPTVNLGVIGQILAVNPAGDGFELIDPGDAGVMTLDLLGDVEVSSGLAEGDTLQYLDGIWTNVAGSASFVDLTDTPGDYTGAANKYVKVNGAGTGLVFQSLFIPTMLSHLADVEMATGITDGDVLRYRDGIWQPEPFLGSGGGGGASSFTDLLDAPSDYVGQAKKFVRVNVAENAVEFSFTNFLDLSDTPDDYSGNANRYVRVNAAGDGLLFQSLFIPTTLGHLADVETGTGTPAEGSYLRWHDGVWQPEPITPGRAPYDFSVGLPTGDAQTLTIPVVRAFRLFDNFAGSKFHGSVSATATTTYTVKKNGSNIGTIVIASGTATATFSTTGSGDETFAIGDLLQIANQATADATLAQPIVTFFAMRDPI